MIIQRFEEEKEEIINYIQKECKSDCFFFQKDKSVSYQTEKLTVYKNELCSQYKDIYLLFQHKTKGVLYTILKDWKNIEFIPPTGNRINPYLVIPFDLFVSVNSLDYKRVNKEAPLILSDSKAQKQIYKNSFENYVQHPELLIFPQPELGDTSVDTFPLREENETDLLKVWMDSGAKTTQKGVEFHTSMEEAQKEVEIFNETRQVNRNVSKDFIEEINENYVRPVHYGGEENPFEPRKIIKHYNLGFNLGNVIKYTLRSGKKGNKVEDLKKAITYLQFEIEES